MTNLNFQCLKSPVLGSRGVVATNHPLASTAGLEMLAMGGNAVDAAIAAAFTLTVVEPMSSGIFGAGYLLFFQSSTGKTFYLDHYAKAPYAATEDLFNNPPSDRALVEHRLGYKAVGVPGNLMAWCTALEELGTLDLPTVLSPAVNFAESGFPISPHFLTYLQRDFDELTMFTETANIFLPRRKLPEIGSKLRQPDLANTLSLISNDGPDSLYRGPIGDAVTRDMKRHNGLIVQRDLDEYRAHWKNPVKGNYRGHDIASLGPSSSGGIMTIEALNILEGFDIAGMGYGTCAYYHLILETLKLCWADRFAYLGDPEKIEVPLETLLSKDFAAFRRNKLNLTESDSYIEGQVDFVNRESNDTTHMTIADSEGNVVSSTQTLNAAFGSKIITPKTGMLLNNCMALFNTLPGTPNSIGSGKRMLSSMSPTMVFTNEKPWFALGTPGGIRIFAAVIQAIINIIDHGMSLQEALEAPRVWTQSQHVETELGIAVTIKDSLRKMGHEVIDVEKVAGGMNGVMFQDESPLIYGSACWRADGSPAGFSGGFATPGHNLDPLPNR